jgi:UDP-N-acetylmuramyl tripeptide synthase
MRMFLTILIGKALQAVAKMRGGGGSAVPGKIVEMLYPEFMAIQLAKLPHGIAIIDGTNGKTTTTRFVTKLLESQGLRIFTNPTGSNFTRGVVSAILENISLSGKLPFDAAVLELDEAYAVHFVNKISPDYSLHLNVMRDQLDRFGEIDTTANMLAVVVQKTKSAVVLNADDSRIARLSKVASAGTRISYFALGNELRRHFLTDDEMYGSKIEEMRNPKAKSSVSTNAIGNEGGSKAAPQKDVLSSETTSTSNKNCIKLLKVADNRAEYLVGTSKVTLTLQLNGVYNMLNVAAGIAFAKEIMSDKLDMKSLLLAAENVTPAFGRGEDIRLKDGTMLQLVLVKNPSGFRLALQSFAQNDTRATMIAINDQYADGRDMSWLWDVDYNSLKSGVDVVSGSRAYDMALRLLHDLVDVTYVNPDLTAALQHFLATNTDKNKRIYCTYTAMLALRKFLAKTQRVEEGL